MTEQLDFPSVQSATPRSTRDRIAPTTRATHEPRDPYLLLLERPPSADSRVEGSKPLDALVLTTPAAVLIDDGGASHARFVDVDPSVFPGVDEHAHPLFATVRTAMGERLLLISAPIRALRVNGLPTPVITPLELGDQITTGSDAIFHVSRRLQSCAEPTPPELVGESCSLCLTALTADTRVLLCATCGAPRHLEGDEVPEADRLACAELGPCVTCASPTAQTAGAYAYLPDGYFPKADPKEVSTSR